MKLNANLRTILVLIFLVLTVRFWDQYSIELSESIKLTGTLTITALGVLILVAVSRKKKGE